MWGFENVNKLPNGGLNKVDMPITDQLFIISGF